MPQSDDNLGAVRPPRRCTVLVVEDDASIRSVIVDSLADQGYSVEEAGDGSAGLRMAKQLQPDVVLLDLALPLRSGLEVLQQLKDHQPTRDIPVIVVSAYALLLVRDESGYIEALVQKPFDLNELLGHVRRLVHGAGP